MADSTLLFRDAVASALTAMIKEVVPNAPDITPESVTIQTPPDPAMGDIGVPLFPYAKHLRRSPQEIAAVVAARISASAVPGTVAAVGPYVNLKFDRADVAFTVLSRITREQDGYGSYNADGTQPFAGRRIMVEFSSPNTNKPLHLGHLRNDALGESVSRLFKKLGAAVYKTNIINDRGVHICKSMLAYQAYHEAQGDTPTSAGMKGDHFVGQCYVEFDQYMKTHPDAQDEVNAMLVKWEQGDATVRALWQRMNDWTLSGIKETYERTGVSFDKLNFESDTYKLGKEEVIAGLEKGIFFKADDGSVRIDISEAVGGANDNRTHDKVVLRADGTSVYITQDFGTAISRHKDWAFDQLIYVVASEQVYHFKALFYILKKLGYDWAKNLYHLSYGLVNLPHGRMKSREGTVVDADDLLDGLHAEALAAIKARGRDGAVGNPDEVAERVALAAVHYYLLQVTPTKDMLFNPEESLSFTGNTGPYLQYMGARIASIVRKAQEAGITPDHSQEACSLMTTAEEWELIKLLGNYPTVMVKAASACDPSVITAYLYEVSKAFSKFYQECPILAAGAPNLVRARLLLAESTLTVLQSAMDLVLVPYLDRM
ncbi:MAG: arginine--tRNA ligase [Treponema sp.]|nr:arginine--tRNA ligase [Treponema sp.]